MDRRIFKGTSIYAAFEHLIESELEDFIKYIDEIDNELKRKQKDLENRYEEVNKEIDSEEQEDVYAFFEDDIQKYFRTFPVYTFNPLLLTIYGQFELWFKKLCELDSRTGLSKVKVSDLHGNNYIEKSRKYLTLVAGLELDPNTSDWKKIVEIQQIRNLIAHNASSISTDKQNQIKSHLLFKTLSNDPRIEFEPEHGDFYIKEKEFLLDTIKLMKKYLFDIIACLKGRKVIARNLVMPYNNETWGQEKTESLLMSIVQVLNEVDSFEQRTDNFRESDFTYNLRGTMSSMASDITKLYAFFLNGKWEATDRDIIVNERKKGIKRLKDLYK